MRGHNFRSIPRQARLVAAFGEEKGKALRAVLEGKTAPEDYESVRRWIRACYHRPSNVELIECACNEILDAHGIEAIEAADGGGPLATYVNMGDTYDATIVFDYRRRRVFLTTWGDWLENWERRGARAK